MMQEMDEVAIGSNSSPVKYLNKLESHSFEFDDGPPDPRIQIELEKLNSCTDLINKLEVDLDESRLMFRQTLSDSTQRIDALTRKLGKCIEQARPYYNARISSKQALNEMQKSAVHYERAVSQHAAAREMVQLAEEGMLTRGCIFDATWQEMLNHATSKINTAEIEKTESESEHKQKSLKHGEWEARVKTLQKQLKRAISKSSLNVRRNLLVISNLARMQDLQMLPYFELKAAVNQRLEQQKSHVRSIEESVVLAKESYAQALSNLESISNQIHKKRQLRSELGERELGVGAESPFPFIYNEMSYMLSLNAKSSQKSVQNSSEYSLLSESVRPANEASSNKVDRFNSEMVNELLETTYDKKLSERFNDGKLAESNRSEKISEVTDDRKLLYIPDPHIKKSVNITNKSVDNTNKPEKITNNFVQNTNISIESTNKSVDNNTNKPKNMINKSVENTATKSVDTAIIENLQASKDQSSLLNPSIENQHRRVKSENDLKGKLLFGTSTDSANYLASRNVGSRFESNEGEKVNEEQPIHSMAERCLSVNSFDAMTKQLMPTKAGRSHSLLSVDGRESITSDTDSLASMEMLSETAIANLMLDEEINEASYDILTSSPYNV